MTAKILPDIGPRGALTFGAAAIAMVTGCSAGPPSVSEPSASAASRSPTAEAAMETATVRVGTLPPLRVEVARTAAEHERGLSGRARLPSGTGMLFVFEDTMRSGFWMHDVHFPLSLAWVRDGRVIGTVEMVPCRSDDPDDCRVYEPPAPYEMVIEAPAKTFAKVDAGASVRIN